MRCTVTEEKRVPANHSRVLTLENEYVKVKYGDELDLDLEKSRRKEIS